MKRGLALGYCLGSAVTTLALFWLTSKTLQLVEQETRLAFLQRQGSPLDALRRAGVEVLTPDEFEQRMAELKDEL